MISDYVNAVLKSGCHLLEVDEFSKDVAAWEGAPLHGHPEFFLIVAHKAVEPPNRS